MNKSLTLLDGFMVGGGIVAAGFMLQDVRGNAPFFGGKGIDFENDLF